MKIQRWAVDTDKNLVQILPDEIDGKEVLPEYSVDALKQMLWCLEWIKAHPWQHDVHQAN